jgi:hypothetical protein
VKMRKITKRDIAGLAVPAALLIAITPILIREYGWFGGLIFPVTAIPFVLWQWIARIRKYPEDTWRPRL